MARTRMIQCGLPLIAVCLACWFFPLFRVQSLGDGKAEDSDAATMRDETAATDPAAFVRELWDGPLRTGDAATTITRLWNAFDGDAGVARSQYGRQAGLGGAWYFCVRGQGTVQAIEKDQVFLSVAYSSRRVCLELGVVVDNTVREAIGVKASDFANSQEFNAVSSELNLRVEKDVITEKRQFLEKEVVVDFVGCAKIVDKADLDPLCLVPIHIHVHGRGVGDPDVNKGRAGATP